MTTAAATPSRGPAALRDMAVVAMLVYGFLVAVGVTAEGLQRLGEPGLEGLRGSLAHPLLALGVGVLGTVVLQSSSVTVGVVVALASAAALPVETVVPLVLGANVGATVPSSLLALGAAQPSREFQRSFACASLHDLLNALAVAVLLPLELLTGALSRAAGALAEAWTGGRVVPQGDRWADDGVTFVRDALRRTGADDTLLGLLMLVIGVALVHQVAGAVSARMQRVLRPRTQVALERTVAGDRGGALGFGLVAALAVQSEVVTASLLVPLTASGVLPLGSAWPVMVGANVSTALAALLAAAAVFGPHALAAALAHVLFNLAAALLLHGVPRLRALPLAAAMGLGRLAGSHRYVVLAGWLAVFVGLPLAGMLVLH